eukprot:7134776-Prymnesium_polylepis.2
METAERASCPHRAPVAPCPPIAVRCPALPCAPCHRSPIAVTMRGVRPAACSPARGYPLWSPWFRVILKSI